MAKKRFEKNDLLVFTLSKNKEQHLWLVIKTDATNEEWQKWMNSDNPLVGVHSPVLIKDLKTGENAWIQEGYYKMKRIKNLGKSKLANLLYNHEKI